MCRRRRETSRLRASSAWWPVAPVSNDPDSSHHVDAAPPLPSTDPFGGWPAFPPTGTDPTDAVLGPPDPRTARPSPGTSPPVGSGPATEAAPDHPVSAPAPASPPPAPVSAPPPSTAPADSDWLPLLTHADDNQRFQASSADRAGPVAEP